MNKIKQNKITFTLILTAITIIFSSLTISSISKLLQLYLKENSFDLFLSVSVTEYKTFKFLIINNLWLNIYFHYA